MRGDQPLDADPLPQRDLSGLTMTAEWLGPDKVDEALARRTGRVLATEVEVPGVGWP